MAVCTSDRIMDVIIASMFFCLLVMVSPVSAYTDQTDELQVASSVGNIYAGDTIPNTVTTLSMCPAGCTGVANEPAWNGFEYYDASGVRGWKSATGYTTSDFSVPSRGSYTKLAPCVVCYCPAGATWHPLKGGYYDWVDGSRPAPSISITVDPSSGTPSFVSTATITGKTDFDTVDYFNVTAPNSTVLNLGGSSAPITIDQEGYWTVRAQVHNSGGTASASANILGGTVYAPVAAFSCSPLNTTSPNTITCTDESSHLPTSWLWTFDSLGVQMNPGSINGGIFYNTNLTQNPVFTVTGSGTINARLEVSNAYGSTFTYKPAYITVSGLVPTPTPTPAVPWPNQTGVCIGSSITLGSGATRDHLEHFQLTSPYGDTFSGQYNIGQVNYVTGYSFFTALKGQYVYQEYDYNTGVLEWQQSYVTEDCAVQTTIPTPVSTTPYTTVPTVPTYTMVTIPTYDFSGKTPGDVVVPGITLPTDINIPQIPMALPNMPNYLNDTAILNQTCVSSNPLSAIFCPINLWMKNFLTYFNNSFMYIILVPFGMIASLTGTIVYAIAEFTGTVSVWSTLSQLYVGLVWNAFMALPVKALNALTVPLLGEFAKQVLDWPEELQK